MKFENVREKALSVSSCDGTRRTMPQGGGGAVADGAGVLDGASVPDGAGVPGGACVPDGVGVPD